MNNQERNAKGNMTIKLLWINLAWLAGLQLATFGYIYSPFALFSHASPGYLRFIVILVPAIVIQSPFQWLILNRVCPSMRSTNIRWVIAMPFLYLLVFTLILFVSLFFGPWPT